MPKSITERKMNMKKTTKKSPMMKIVSAAAMLAVSASMLATSTYAWFSMNTTVNVTGMQVDVKSNNTFLLINTGEYDTCEEIQGQKKTTIPATVEAAEAVVYPSKPKEASEIGEGKRFESGTAVTNATTAATAANWYTAQNNNPADSNDSVKGVHDLNTTDGDVYNIDSYVIKRTVYLTLAQGAENANSLTVKPTIAKKEGAANTDDISAVKVLVATGNNYAILDSTMTTAQSLHSTTNTTLTDTSVVTVDIYIYYDGEEDAVYTNNKANLAEADIELQFDVTVV